MRVHFSPALEVGARGMEAGRAGKGGGVRAAHRDDSRSAVIATHTPRDQTLHLQNETEQSEQKGARSSSPLSSPRPNATLASDGDSMLDYAAFLEFVRVENNRSLRS